MCAAGRVLYAEVIHIETHLTQRGSSAGTCQSCTHYDDVKLELVLGVHQTLMSLIVGPFLCYRTLGNLRIDYLSHNSLMF